MGERTTFVKLGYDEVMPFLTLRWQILLFMDRVQLPLETSSDRGARGLEFESGVKHVIAKRLVDHSHLLGNLMVSSRDFV